MLLGSNLPTGPPRTSMCPLLPFPALLPAPTSLWDIFLTTVGSLSTPSCTLANPPNPKHPPSLPLHRTCQPEIFSLIMAWKASPLPERPLRLPVPISSFPLPNHPALLPCPSVCMAPQPSQDPLLCPGQSAALIPVAVCGGSAMPGTPSLSSGATPLPPPTPPPPSCSIGSAVAAKSGRRQAGLQ